MGVIVKRNKFEFQFRLHGRNLNRRVKNGNASVIQSFRPGTISGLINVAVPIFLNLGDATSFNRSNLNGYNNIL